MQLIVLLLLCYYFAITLLLLCYYNKYGRQVLAFIEKNPNLPINPSKLSFSRSWVSWDFSIQSRTWLKKWFLSESKRENNKERGGYFLTGNSNLIAPQFKKCGARGENKIFSKNNLTKCEVKLGGF